MKKNLWIFTLCWMTCFFGSPVYGWNQNSQKKITKLVDIIQKNILDQWHPYVTDRLKSEIQVGLKKELPPVIIPYLDQIHVDLSDSPALILNFSKEEILFRAPRNGFYKVQVRASYRWWFFTLASLSIDVDLVIKILQKKYIMGKPDMVLKNIKVSGGGFLGGLVALFSRNYIKQQIQKSLSGYGQILQNFIQIDPIDDRSTLPFLSKPYEVIYPSASTATPSQLKITESHYIDIVFIPDLIFSQTDLSNYNSILKYSVQNLFKIAPFSVFPKKIRIWKINLKLQSTLKKDKGRFFSFSKKGSKFYKEGVYIIPTNYSNIAKVIQKLPIESPDVIITLAPSYWSNTITGQKRTYNSRAFVMGNLVSLPLHRGAYPYTKEKTTFQVLVHELGHTRSLGGLYDEYINYLVSYYGESPISPNASVNKTKWKQWNGVKGVGYYEGATWKSGIYRPAYQCRMNNIGTLWHDYPFCPVCKEALTINFIFGSPYGGKRSKWSNSKVILSSPGKNIVTPINQVNKKVFISPSSLGLVNGNLFSISFSSSDLKSWKWYYRSKFYPTYEVEYKSYANSPSLSFYYNSGIFAYWDIVIRPSHPLIRKKMEIVIKIQ